MNYGHIDNGNGSTTSYADTETEELPLEPKIKRKKDSLTTKIPPESFKYDLEFEIPMKKTIEEQYYQALSLEEKNFYDNLSREEQKWYLEIGTTEIGGKIMGGLEAIGNKMESNTKDLKDINAEMKSFNNMINIFNI